MKSQQEEVTDLVEKEAALIERMKADADKIATALIPRARLQGHRHVEVPLRPKPSSQGSSRAWPSRQVRRDGHAPLGA